jgi:hypothetical protein
MSYMMNNFDVPDVACGVATGVDDRPTSHKEALDELASALLKCKNALGDAELIEVLYRYGAGKLQYPGVVFKNGKRMSVQASVHHYCSKEPTNWAHAFTTVEVWEQNATDPECITAAELMERAEAHGGIAYGSLPPLDFGRDPKRPKRELDSAVIEQKIRKSQRTRDLGDKPYRGRISKWCIKKVNNLGVGQVVGEWDGEEFSSSALAKQIMFKDGIYQLETKNSLYAACEHDRIVVDAKVNYGSDGRVRLSVTATPTSVRTVDEIYSHAPVSNH